MRLARIISPGLIAELNILRVLYVRPETILLNWDAARMA